MTTIYLILAVVALFAFFFCVDILWQLTFGHEFDDLKRRVRQEKGEA